VSSDFAFQARKRAAWAGSDWKLNRKLVKEDVVVTKTDSDSGGSSGLTVADVERLGVEENLGAETLAVLAELAAREELRRGC